MVFPPKCKAVKMHWPVHRAVLCNTCMSRRLQKTRLVPSHTGQLASNAYSQLQIIRFIVKVSRHAYKMSFSSRNGRSGKEVVKPDLKGVSMVPGMLGLVPHHLLLTIAILLWVQLGCQAADVVGEGLGGGLVHWGSAQLPCQTGGLRLNQLALNDQCPRGRFCTTDQTVPEAPC